MTVTESMTTLRCATCGAEQAPSLECRRCRCDLTLVVAVFERQTALRRQFLRRLQDGQFAESLEIARQLWWLGPDPEATRALAVAYLLNGRFQAALDVYQRARHHGDS